MFTITFFRPYYQDWVTQSFPTREEAEHMLSFYRSCGSPCRMV